MFLALVHTSESQLTNFSNRQMLASEKTFVVYAIFLFIYFFTIA